MKIALIGYGKMGKEIEQIALERGHIIALKIDNQEEWNSKINFLKQCDVAIDFSQPNCVLANIRHCFNTKTPLVCGTTGWHEHKEEIEQEVKDKNLSFFWASNFSLGVNIFFQVNRVLADLMSKIDAYDLDIKETHHIHKKDAPSGTAISLAEDIISKHPQWEKWKLDEGNQHCIPIYSSREGEVPGTHTINYTSSVDKITITHQAKNRKGFAKGAVLAAEFIKNKKGFFDMNDLLNIHQSSIEGD